MLTTGYISILQQSSFIYTLLLLIGGGGNNGHNTNNDNNSTTSSNDSWDDTDLTLKQRRTREDGGLMLEPDDFDDFVTSLVGIPRNNMNSQIYGIRQTQESLYLKWKGMRWKGKEF